MLHETQHIQVLYRQDKYGARPVHPTTELAKQDVGTHGTVALLCTYGSDQLIAEAARVSYGKRDLLTTTELRMREEKDRTLIRYLMRHRHTSPFEQAEVTFFLRLPIFVARQLIRHRTANVNEYSARYTELSDDYYVPEPAHIGAQSTSNKQGTDTSVELDRTWIIDEMETAQRYSVDSYTMLLEHGVSREQARIVMPLGTYTEMYWKCDVHNFLHFLRLRLDAHAQYEIRVFAEAMASCVEPFFPLTFDAFTDYVRHAYTLSVLEQHALQKFFLEKKLSSAEDYGMSAREYKDFLAFLEKNGMNTSS